MPGFSQLISCQGTVAGFMLWRPFKLFLNKLTMNKAHDFWLAFVLVLVAQLAKRWMILFYLFCFHLSVWVRIPVTPRLFSKCRNFKGQKHHDSPELTIPDYDHLNSYFMENILAYTNSAHRIALKMPLFYGKTKHL